MAANQRTGTRRRGRDGPPRWNHEKILSFLDSEDAPRTAPAQRRCSGRADLCDSLTRTRPITVDGQGCRRYRSLSPPRRQYIRFFSERGWETVTRPYSSALASP